MTINAINTLKIENNSLSNETINIATLYSYYSKLLEESGLLVSGNFERKKVKTTGKFDDSTWVIYKILTSSYGYFEFEKLEELRFTSLSKDQLILIKSWIAKKLLDRKCTVNNEHNVLIMDIRTSESAITFLNYFVKFVKCSNNFSEEFLNLDKGDEIGNFFTELSLKLNSSNLRSAKLFILDYLRFAFIKNHLTDKIYCYEFYPEYIRRIELVLDDTSGLMKDITYNSNDSADDEEDVHVHLPSSTNILKLNYYIDKFFKDKTIDEDVKMYYYPILIWWKVTLVLPMRISEITAKTPRNCLSTEGNSYFLTIGRIKEKNVKRSSLPLVTKFKITKEIYDLIDFYIKKTDECGDTRTLMSYKALIYFRRIIGAKYPHTFNGSYIRNDKGMFRTYKANADIKKISKDNKPYIGYEQSFNDINNNKYDEELFSRTPFNNLLISFYNKIIETYYEDTSITERLRGNQTRHLAFSYLVLQGVPKVEIAILGGHSDIKSMDSYTYDNDIYIDTQVIVNINKKLGEKKVSEESLYNKVFSMPRKCSVSKEECVPTEFDDVYLGCCTATKETACESFTCYTCSHWYCDPTFENFTTLIEIVRNEIKKDKDILHNNIKLITKLIENSGEIQFNGEELSLNKDYFQSLQRSGNKIESSANKIINAKTKLLESMLENNTEYSELEIIDKLRLLNETFNKDTIFIK